MQAIGCAKFSMIDRRRLMTLAFTLTGVFGFIRATEPNKSGKEGEEWLVRTIQVPGDLVHTWEVAGAFDSKQLELKPLPPADAPESQLIENIRHNTAALLKHEWLAGGAFPEGTAFLLDTATSTLAVRTNAAGMEFLDAISQEFGMRQPHYLALSFELFQAEATTVRRLLQEGDGKADNTAQFNRLKELVAAGEAKNIGTLKLETRSGQRAVLESTHEHNVCSGVSVDDKGKLETSN